MGKVWELMLEVLDVILSTFMQLITVIISAVVDAFVYLFHTGLLKPLIQELMGSFSMSTSMFHENSADLISLILSYCYEKIRIVGFAILLLVAFWQVFKTFFAYSGYTQTEESWKIAAKLILYGLLVLYSKQICQMSIGAGVGIVNLLGQVQVESKQVVEGETKIIYSNDILDMVGVGNINVKVKVPVIEINKSDVGTTMKAVVNNLLTKLENFEVNATNPAAPIIKFILIIMIDLQLLKISLDMTEKYMNLLLMVIISPVAFACGVSKATNKILNKWVSLFASCIVYQVLQFVIIGMVYFIVSDPNGDGIFKILILVWCILEMSLNINDLINELGFAQLGKSSTGVLRMAKGLNAMGEEAANLYGRGKNIGNGIGKKMSGGGTTSSGDIEASVKNQDSGEGIGVSVQNTKSGPDINLQV